VGGRIEASLSPKVLVDVLGDVGGWGSGSQLEYQWAGLLGYRLSSKWALQAGYRYLYVDKHSGRDVIFKVATSGVIFGINLTLR